MPKEQQPAKLRWKKNGPIAAQLFRDIYFGKYKKGSDGKFNAREIATDPNREYKNLARTSFYNHIEQVSKRVDQYKLNGTGLETEEFRRLVNLTEPPPPEDRAADENVASDSEEDSDFFEDEEDDITLEGFEEEESAFAEARELGEIKNTKQPSGKKKKISRSASTLISEMTESGDTKYLATEPDGRLVCVIHLPSGFDGTIEFNDGETKNKVLLKEHKQQWMYNAARVFEQKGLDANNIHVVTLQEEMNKQKDKDIKATGENPESYDGPIIKSRTVFDLPFPVTPYFYDEKGKQTYDINVDGNDAEWAFFWMLDASKVPKPRPRATRLVRNRNRRRTESPHRSQPSGTRSTNQSVHVDHSNSEGETRRFSPRRRVVDEDESYFYFDAEDEDDASL